MKNVSNPFLIVLIVLKTFASSAEIEPNCGQRKKLPSSTRIIGGSRSDIELWPWAVSIRVFNRHICGGSLISENVVLTAAHCFNGISTSSVLSITAGSTFLSSINEKRSAKHVFLHRNYDRNSYRNDIALIVVSSPFSINRTTIASVCFPKNRSQQIPQVDLQLFAIGWGIANLTDRTSSDVLREVSLRTVSSNDRTCENSIFDDRIQFCAASPTEPKDTCQGDSGGPLLLFDDERWFVVGITSYGRGCALPDYAGVYTRVSVYSRWIECFLEMNETCVEQAFYRAMAPRSSTNILTMVSLLFSTVIHRLHQK